MRTRYRGTAARVDTVENDRWRTGHPQIPARTDLAFDLDKDLPTGFVVVEEFLTHLLAIQGLEHRLEQRGDGLQATGQRAG